MPKSFRTCNCCEGHEDPINANNQLIWRYDNVTRTLHDIDIESRVIKNFRINKAMQLRRLDKEKHMNKNPQENVSFVRCCCGSTNESQVVCIKNNYTIPVICQNKPLSDGIYNHFVFNLQSILGHESLCDLIELDPNEKRDNIRHVGFVYANNAYESDNPVTRYLELVSVLKEIIQHYLIDSNDSDKVYFLNKEY